MKAISRWAVSQVATYISPSPIYDRTMEALKLERVPWGAGVILLFATVAYSLTAWWVFNAVVCLLLGIYFLARGIAYGKEGDVISFACSLLYVAFLHLSELTPNKKLRRFFDAIELSMSREAISLLEEIYFPRDEKFMRLLRVSYSRPIPTRSYRLDTRVSAREDNIIKLRFSGNALIAKEW